MAVLVEGISVVFRAGSINDKYPGGWEQFCEDVPNQTLCADGDLVRVGFMNPDDVKDYVLGIVEKGLNFFDKEATQDLIVADQQFGFTTPCDWAVFGRARIGGDDGGVVALCYLSGTENYDIVPPDGWEYKKSLSASFSFVPNGCEWRLKTVALGGRKA